LPARLKNDDELVSQILLEKKALTDMGHCPPWSSGVDKFEVRIIGKQLHHLQGGVDTDSGGSDVETGRSSAFVRYTLFYTADTRPRDQYLGTPVFSPKEELLAIDLWFMPWRRFRVYA
jgi:hypothetical protein